MNANVICAILAIFILSFIIITMNCRGDRETFVEKSAEIVGETSIYRLQVTPNYSTVVKKLHGASDQTIILIHNSPFTQETWTPVLMHAQKHRHDKHLPTLITYDLMGYGSSWLPVPPQYNDANVHNRAWTYDMFVAQLYAIYSNYVDGAPTKKVTIAGYGFGGSIAQAFALQYPSLIDNLIILSSTVSPTITGTPYELNYLVNWIAKNPRPTYLTLEEKFVNNNLCKWFDNDILLTCSSNSNRDHTPTDIVSYLLAAMMYRETNCQAYLQVDKLVSTGDLRRWWRESNVDFPVSFLFADDDNYMSKEQLTSDINDMKRATTRPVTLYTVKGRHGFVLSHPMYIYKLLTGLDVADESISVQVF